MARTKWLIGAVESTSLRMRPCMCPWSAHERNIHMNVCCKQCALTVLGKHTAGTCLLRF